MITLSYNNLSMLRNTIRVISKYADQVSHQSIMLSEDITYTCTITRINRPTPFAVTTTARLRASVHRRLKRIVRFFRSRNRTAKIMSQR